MLVILSGSSGVGKTEIMRNLNQTYDWNIIPTYTTRNLREEEKEKTSISQEKFNQLERQEEFFHVDNFFNNSYGVKKKSVERAIKSSKEIWLLDRPIWCIHSYESYPLWNIIILPENRDQLEKQILASNRKERLIEVMEEYHKYYERYHHENLDRTFSAVLINRPGKIKEIAMQIESIINPSSIK